MNFVKTALVASALAAATSPAIAGTIDGAWSFTYANEGSNWTGTFEANYAPDTYESILGLTALSGYGHTNSTVSPVAQGAFPGSGTQPDDLLLTPSNFSGGTFSFGELTQNGFAFATSIGVDYRIWSNPNAIGGFNIQQCIGRSCLTQSGSFSVTFGSTAGGTDTGQDAGTGTTTSVPEPSTLGLMGLALLGLAFKRRTPLR